MGEKLPFRDQSFDGIFLVNVLEHVAGVEAVLSECSRVLKSGGLWFAITPNGDWNFLLDLAEWLRMKIPEGPHVFLRTERLAAISTRHYEIITHRTF